MLALTRTETRARNNLIADARRGVPGGGPVAVRAPPRRTLLSSFEVYCNTTKASVADGRW
eukprot:7130364-Prymnesium_polylepis.2